MCGIVGIFSNNDRLHRKVDEAIEKLHHRGPDYQATKRIHPNLSFAHSRLSIVDLNERSHQPFFDPQTGNYIIFNGEIYNYKELKKLIPHREFHTNSDTEVFLYLLSDLDHKEVLNKCNGMFAFALWLEREQKLILGRDRFGKKPLFYHIDKNGLKFASEAKALKSLDVHFEVNHEAVINYIFEITIGKNEQSFFKNIQQIKNGALVYYSISHEGKIFQEKVEQYWHYPQTTRKIKYQEAVEEFRNLLTDAVNTRLAEEVDFAVMISGGLDSSSVASFAAKYNSSKYITSISAVYPGDEKDESYFAKLVTDKYSNLNPIWVNDINHEKFHENVNDVIYHLESPIADGSLIAQHILMKKIREKGIKVILSGNGGDEVLAGYPTIFLPAYELEEWKNGKFSFPTFRTLYHLLPNAIKNYMYKEKHKKLGILKNDKILKHNWKRFNDFGTDDKLNNYLINGLEHWTLPNLMWYEDRNSMAASIESRCPLLDYRIVEFLLSIPASYKINKNFTKRILRDAAKNVVPQPILDRTDKQGFHAPTNKWVEYIDKNFLKDSSFIEEFDYLNLNKIESAPFRIYWRTFTLYLWYKKFFV